MMTLSATGLMSAEPLRPCQHALRQLRFGDKGHPIGDLYLPAAVEILRQLHIILSPHALVCSCGVHYGRSPVSAPVMTQHIRKLQL